MFNNFYPLSYKDNKVRAHILSRVSRTDDYSIRIIKQLLKFYNVSPSLKPLEEHFSENEVQNEFYFCQPEEKFSTF